MPRAEGQGGAAQQQEHRSDQGHDGPEAMGDGGPGPETVIGIPVLFPHFGPAGSGLCGIVEHVSAARKRIFLIHGITSSR